ncbi:hypothetical protein BCR32DRAFT_271023, partial [Anaeromyces robustus]
MKEQINEQKRKGIQNNEGNKKKRTKGKEEKINKKEKEKDNVKNETSKIVVPKKRGPRSGFLNDMVKDRVKKILSDSNIPYSTENGEFVYSNNNLNSEVNTKDDSFSCSSNDNSYSISNNENTQENSIAKQSEINNLENNNKDNNNNNNNKKNLVEVTYERLSNFYFKILKDIDDNKDDIQKSHNFKNIIPLDGLKDLNIPTDFKFSNTDTDDEKLFYQSLLEFTTDDFPNIIHLNYKLLTDFFNYAHAYAPIIHPSALVLRIKNRTLSPCLLLVIYAMTYLFIPNQNKRLSRFYADKSQQYLLAHIHTLDIQNIHTAYLLANLEPGTNRSYLFSGIALRLLKVLKVLDFDRKPNTYIERILYEERVKTLWCCLGKDSLMNITSNSLEYPRWLDQPLPQCATDISIINYYTPKRLAVVFMAVVICLTKIIRYARLRRDNIIDVNIFKKSIDEINEIYNLLEDHISLSKHAFSSNTHPQLACIIYHYTLYFTTKLVLFNIELSPYIYKGKLDPSKKYIQLKRKPQNISNIIKDICQKLNINKEEEIDSEFNLFGAFTNHSKSEVNTITSQSLISLSLPLNEYINLNSKSKVPESNFSSNSINSDLDYEYYSKTILAKIPISSFNYKLYDEKNDDNTNDSKKIFLKIPPFLKTIDYENCFNVCFETAEKATNALKILVNYLEENLRYQSSLCWTFYNLGLFYMNVYANFKREDLKETIEFYHDQIKIMYKNFPDLSVHYSKIYEEAKIEAYTSFLDDNIIFCPRGYY